MNRLYSFLLFTLILNTQVIAQLTTTNLPIIKITTTTPIVGTKTEASLSIIDNITGLNNVTNTPTFTGVIGISDRNGLAGNFPSKPSYNIETWINSSAVSLDTSLLGMPSENDWVLLASYADRSFARNLLPNTLYQNMGNYAPRLKLCEVLLDNVYKGVYLFGEKVKRDTFRVDVAKLEPFEITDPLITGGYILKVTDNNTPDWTSTKPPYGVTAAQTTDFFIEYPDVLLMPASQKNYIKGYVDSFENALSATNFQDELLGWRNFGGYTSFMDYMIINEVSKNLDAYRNNFYMHKGKSKKLKPGPLWEMDLAFRNTATCNISADTGFSYLLADYCSNEKELPVFYFEKLTRDTAFMKDLKCRYKDLRSNILSIAKINSTLDSISIKMNVINAGNSPQDRNFTLFPIFGTPLVNEPMPMSTNYAGEITAMKTFIQARLSYLDTKWATNAVCFPVSTTNISSNEIVVNMYPNPAINELNININAQEEGLRQVIIYDLQGKKCVEQNIIKNSFKINTQNLQNGIYFVKVRIGEKYISQKLVINK